MFIFFFFKINRCVNRSCLVSFVLCFEFQLVPVSTTQFGQADLFKTETHTEAPMTQLGRAAASGSIIDHGWFVKKLSELKNTTDRNNELRLSLLIFVSANIFVARPFRTAAAIGSTIIFAWLRCVFPAPAANRVLRRRPVRRSSEKKAWTTTDDGQNNSGSLNSAF